MIIKKLYEEYDISLEKILIKEFRRLKMSINEMSLLLILFLMNKKRRNFSIGAISRRVDFNQNEIEIHIESLMSKGFINILLENKDGREREVLDIEPTFNKIEELFRKDNLERVKQLYESSISETIKLIEQGLGRALRPYELENIRRWYEEKKYQHSEIKKAIETAKDKVSIKYIERILTSVVPNEIEVDEDIDAALDELFKKIR